ncbi:HSP20-like chaperone [Roridomyces roridus]|uniref:HSP20-like chaperone n=1 Tax=Roridomyces roridus TaxID=1738132 RepID=A0AAD7CB50_9AGAR|nr:HSP20-like chaperone [Roridomyces roridus]
MSIARQLLHEFRPFFRMLDEPIARPLVGFGGRSRSLFDDPFFSSLNRDMLRGPAVDVRESGNSYVVEAEVPGVKKENLEVRVGEGGRSLSIEGKVMSSTNEGGNENSSREQPTLEEKSTQISTERSVIGQFSRTVFLPRPVDTSSITAKLEDGVLRITVSKAEDKGVVVVPVE